MRDLAANVGDVSLSANGSTVYYEGTAGHLDPFPIYRVPTRGGPPRKVASGEDPAASPDGSELAYATASGDAIAIENVRQHTTRRIDLTALIGAGASFRNTPGVVTWLNRSELIAIPPGDSSPFGSPSGTAPPPARPGTCTAAYVHGQQCAIVIDLGATRPAHIVTLPLPHDTAVIAVGPGPTPGTLLMGGFGTVTRFSITTTGAARQTTMSVPDDGLVEAFSPSGDQVLYLRNHGPVQLWSGTLGGSHVSQTTELLANADLGSASW